MRPVERIIISHLPLRSTALLTSGALRAPSPPLLLRRPAAAALKKKQIQSILYGLAELTSCMERRTGHFSLFLSLGAHCTMSMEAQRLRRSAFNYHAKGTNDNKFALQHFFMPNKSSGADWKRSQRKAVASGHSLLCARIVSIGRPLISPTGNVHARSKI